MDLSELDLSQEAEKHINCTNSHECDCAFCVKAREVKVIYVESTLKELKP